LFILVQNQTEPEMLSPKWLHDWFIK
jgi:hypothetical protein